MSEKIAEARKRGSVMADLKPLRMGFQERRIERKKVCLFSQARVQPGELKGGHTRKANK